MSRPPISPTRTGGLATLAALAAWGAVAVMLCVVATLLAGRTGYRTVAAAQSLTPYLMGAAMPLAAAALVAGRWRLAAVAAAVAVTFVVVAWPLLRPPAQPAAADGATPMRVLHGNLLYHNDRHGEIIDTLAAVADDVDVLAFTEYTPTFAATLHASAIAADFPHRIEYSASGGDGAALWSRHPLTLIDRWRGGFTNITARVESRSPVAVTVAHVTSPIVNPARWSRNLRSLHDPPAADAPLMIVGDLNASWWHPAFRRLIDSGWNDAHRAAGRAFSTSWPNDARPIPPFVRIDHALVDDSLHVVDVIDIDIPGSDHIGFIVEVVAADSTDRELELLRSWA